ncbi:MAG: 30S ribosomal protein S15 [Bdellovibrionales bacterium RIFOXYB1_FULL_37_110]|nr:MAG: 30S ribosomal protein S15 [Bdellovibrionales bacterium RIFOXYA1_FULL_38_20]OFZ50231.1 MAG: 30S ribosomal protein S15 [Bdellovibrionales bacterium RIFOXYC1_FULL_37_79]OFZ57668.1 MAG: 30S ribosomal protein S15 [Bdellovibrionales bacterium RIFOXYB1_FULL_37_110]OFZ61435.1 MAG: 30S ribosomal protein S15 [Bdellovibrionales bacterium RIFOXYD1_FULL_36_51]OFZ67298.1 MAG: 30S ribosomal protein S15 [Bdellovibrionales bacterium RIFOXYB2_FULL_36_6]
MITKERTAELILKFGKSPNDSGATEVQIALLTERINGLKDHFQAHKKDFSSNRGLMKMIGQRRRLLRFLAAKNEENYASLIKELGLRK